MPADRGVGPGVGLPQQGGRRVAGDLGDGQDGPGADGGVGRAEAGRQEARAVLARAGQRPAQGSGDVRVGLGQDGFGQGVRRCGPVLGGGQGGPLARARVR